MPASFDRNRDWLPYLNNAGETVPAFAVVRITGITAGVYQVSKPNAYGSFLDHAFNQAVDVPSGGKGMLSFAAPVWGYYDTADGTPAFGESWGPINASWKLRKLSVGFLIDGGATADRVLVRPSFQFDVFGQFTGTVAAGSTGTLNVYYYSAGTWTALSIGSQQTISTVRNASGASRAATDKLMAGKRFVDAQWLANLWNCP